MKRLIAWLQMVPKIVGTIIELDSVIPFGKLGAQKLQLLITAIRLIWDTQEEVKKVFPWTELESLIKTAASTFVGLLKEMGVLKSQPEATSPVQ